MTQKRKIALGALIVLLSAAVLAGPFLFRTVTLYWVKSRAHATFDKLSPVERESLNATPSSISLPRLDPTDPPLKGFDYESFIFHLPPPQSRDVTKKQLWLQYPQFTVYFMPAFSMSPETFELTSAANHMRLDDIDTQTDLESLRKLLLLLPTKGVRFFPRVCFAEYNSSDRRGIIRARDKDKHIVHAEIYFPASHIGCGMYFENPNGVSESDMLKFLATMQIETKPPTTAPTTLP